MTSIMRGSDAFPFWAELRAELSRIGIDPHQALLVESYENDGTEVGVIVAPEASVAEQVRMGSRSFTAHPDASPPSVDPIVSCRARRGTVRRFPSWLRGRSGMRRGERCWFARSERDM